MTPAQLKRIAIWQHNSFRGHAKMMIANCRSIQESTTATDQAKALAANIAEYAQELYNELKDRRP